ncbi:hypothetical protein VF04_04025 [Nostoc linckia z7]|uniref:Uncharacterized protein n=2 Tax=Nostoc linckia TaxID=92942 RepID=A0A9Q5ZG23_NOSLI|nr:hypothetical protein [Nostoc linckia]PHK42884.1 hypothetical protein VF12_00725 [Nostoc linckia z15]PHK48041.1 hypothetical protein VF13_01700 [Nostoc linckia z16]PHJ64961.1 hypothetical protein VF02_11510 [Nostoc linckia z1]PHJ70139.1 hypothetical protein VF05_11670 [Nostoc linckia z3]PHJ75040.1 hypothetical protein VF03_11830 [Nostoc linckia z2]
MDKFVMLGNIQFECSIIVDEGETIYEKAGDLLENLASSKSARLFVDCEDGETRIVFLKIVDAESQDIAQT